jgi:septal ring factor EnvC (AmiA/AmiB activator)
MAFPPSVRHAAIIRDQARCRHCGTTEREADLEVHHIVPENRGGKDTLSNAATLCLPCHAATHGHVSTKNTPISDTDIRMRSIERLIEERCNAIEQRDEELANVRNEIESIEELRADLEDLREQKSELRRRNDFLEGKIEAWHERDVVSKERFERLQDRHLTLIDAAWQAADPPVVYEDPGRQSKNSENQPLFTALLSKLKPWV